MIRKLILKILEAIGGNVFYIGGNDVLPPPLSPEEEKFFFRMVKSGFSQRRKTAANAFASLMDIPKEQTYSALESLGLPKTARIESLDMEQLIALSRKLKNI